MRVFVLLFNAGQENEGIHTLKTPDRNVVLMFVSEDDAIRYGLMLEAQDFVSPSVEEFESEEIEEFCQDAGFDCKLVPEGMLTVPPETTITQQTGQLMQQVPKKSAEDENEDEDEDQAEEKSDFSQSELDEIRRRFEGLL